jgi:hypothetical protein
MAEAIPTARDTFFLDIVAHGVENRAGQLGEFRAEQVGKSLFPNGDFALTCANAVYLIGEKFQSARSIPLYQIPLEKDVQKGTDLLIRRK